MLKTTKEIIENFIRLKPNSAIAMLSQVVGIEAMGNIFESEYFQGRQMYFPRLSSLIRIQKSLYIKEKLKGLAGKKRENMVEELATIFSMPKPRIERIAKNKRYSYR